MVRFRTTNPVWATLDTPSDQLMPIGDEKDERISFRSVEIWNVFRHTMSVVETCMSDDAGWRALFNGGLI